MRRISRLLTLSLVLTFASTGPAWGQAAAEKAAQAKTKSAAKKKEAPKRATVSPTEANVPYGTHERQKVDFFKATSESPTPVVLFIHGGGWVNGDKSGVQNALEIAKLLKNGISVVAVQYRMVPDAQANGVEPPVKWPLEDAKRALQFVRSKAKEWKRVQVSCSEKSYQSAVEVKSRVTFRWAIGTPFGLPVDPDVKMT